MSIWNWLSKPKTFMRCEDMYASSWETYWPALIRILGEQIESGKTVWLVAHFTDSFSWLQSAIEDSGMDYDVVTRPISINNLAESDFLQPAKIKLVLAELLQSPPEFASLEKTPSKTTNEILNATLAFIVIERHPFFEHSERLVEFAKQIPCKTEFGFVNSLEDIVIHSAIGETAIQVLKQLGLDSHEMITSTMVTRRLNKLLRRNAEGYTTDHPADSAEQWIELNG